MRPCAADRAEGTSAAEGAGRRDAHARGARRETPAAGPRNDGRHPARGFAASRGVRPGQRRP